MAFFNTQSDVRVGARGARCGASGAQPARLDAAAGDQALQRSRRLVHLQGLAVPPLVRGRPIHPAGASLLEGDATGERARRRCSRAPAHTAYVTEPSANASVVHRYQVGRMCTSTSRVLARSAGTSTTTRSWTSTSTSTRRRLPRRRSSGLSLELRDAAGKRARVAKWSPTKGRSPALFHVRICDASPGATYVLGFDLWASEVEACRRATFWGSDVWGSDGVAGSVTARSQRKRGWLAECRVLKSTERSTRHAARLV
eukprot:375662-Prymnesium_polylepis.1